MAERKTGRLSNEEMAFITANAENMTYEELAEKLNRTIDPIKKHIEEKLGKNIDGRNKLLYNAKKDIQNRPYWAQLELQFSSEELDLFVYHWGLMYEQMKEDITHTEELQVVEVIKFEILTNRVLINQKSIMDNINNINNILENEKNKDNPDTAKIVNLERQLAGFYAGHDNLSKEHRDLSDKKQSILKALKMTRDQRVKNLEDSKESIISWFRIACENKPERIKMGLEMEKMRLAMDKERERLGKYHTYADGEIDRPLLTPAIVEKEQE